MKSVAIIDGSYNIYRSVFKGLNMTTSAGVPSGGTFIFLKMLWNIKELGKPIVILDSGHSKFRTELFPGYKQRAEKTEQEKEEDKEVDLAFSATFSILKKLLPNMGIPVVSVQGEEADDVAYVLAKHLKDTGTEKIYTVSDDGDWEQNVLIPATVFKAMKDEYITAQNFEEKRGFPPEFFTLYKSMIGDGSDGIPGVHGIGDKSAIKIIKQLKDPSLLSLSEWSKSGDSKMHEKVRNQFSIVKRNMLLMDFKHVQIPVETVVQSYETAAANAQVNFEYVKNKFQSLEFKSLTDWLVYLATK